MYVLVVDAAGLVLVGMYVQYYCLRVGNMISLRSRQVGAIHPLYLYSAMSDVSFYTSSSGRRASGPTSQES
jgi:hypothetical protein